VRAAVATIVELSGLSCYQYDAWDIPADDFCTIGAAEWVLNEGSDQRYGVRAVTLPVMLYSQVDGNAEQSLAYQEAALHKIIDELGLTRTLGGRVAYSDVDQPVQQYFLRNPNGQTYSVITIPLTVYPFANRAS
jgi:hypothetical protein